MGPEGRGYEAEQSAYQAEGGTCGKAQGRKDSRSLCLKASGERRHQSMQHLVEHAKEFGLYSKYSGASMGIRKEGERRLIYVVFLQQFNRGISYIL